MKIIIVDDNPGTTRLLTGVLRDDLGNNVITAGSSKRGADLIDERLELETIDLVLVKKDCPDQGSGLEVARKVKEKFPRAKVVLMTDEVMNEFRSLYDAILRRSITRDDIKEMWSGLFGEVTIPNTT